jgi:eukaryotic-like serine/threonine-protein kinase
VPFSAQINGMAASVVGPYRILERLGAGANGVVFLAEDTRLQRRVALKTLFAPGNSEASDLRRKLLREARAAARLNHPNIAAVYDVLESEEGVHIVMEYVPGTTLAARVRHGALSPLEVLDLALQLAAALEHAHAVGVVHRDLKPANIMIGAGGGAKILDFGLARLHDARTSSLELSSSDLSTESRHIVGTPPYIPPEHLRGSTIDERGDVYSLGVTLYELLTGHRPFAAAQGLSLTDAILSAPTPRPRSLSPDVPKALDDIVYRAMARNPDDRYPSAAALQRDLDRLRVGITDAPTRSTAAFSWMPGVARRRPIAIAVVGLVVVATALYAARERTRARAQPTNVASSSAAQIVAVLPFTNLTGDASNDYLGVGIADVLTTALTRVSGINVVPRSSVALLQNRSPRDAARELGANLVVEGGVHRSEDRIRVTVSVLRAGVGALAWSRSYEGRLREILSLQSEVAEALASELKVTLSPLQRSRVEAAPTTDESALDDYMMARALLDRPDRPGNLDRAVELFENAIGKDGSFAVAHAGLGEASWMQYQQSKDASWIARARESTDRALQLDPDQPAARYSLAVILNGTGHRDEAMVELRRAAALMPGFDDAHRLLGRLLIAAGQSEAGLLELRRAIAIRPSYWRNHDAIGQAYYDLGQYKKATEAFERVTNLQPDNAWGYQSLGTAYHALGDRRRAAENYRRSLSLSPDPGSYSNLGTLYYSEGRYRDALDAYQHALRLAPQEPVAHRNVADAYRRLGLTDKAHDAYSAAARLTRAALRVNPQDALTRAKLAVYEAKLGQHEEAAREIERAVVLSPRDFEVLYRQAVVLALAGRQKESAAALERAIANGFSRDFAREDEDLAPLRRQADYRAIFEGKDNEGRSTR